MWFSSLRTYLLLLRANACNRCCYYVLLMPFGLNINHIHNNYQPTTAECTVHVNTTTDEDGFSFLRVAALSIAITHNSLTLSPFPCLLPTSFLGSVQLTTTTTYYVLLQSSTHCTTTTQLWPSVQYYTTTTTLLQQHPFTYRTTFLGTAVT